MIQQEINKSPTRAIIFEVIAQVQEGTDPTKLAESLSDALQWIEGVGKTNVYIIDDEKKNVE